MFPNLIKKIVSYLEIQYSNSLLYYIREFKDFKDFKLKN